MNLEVVSNIAQISAVERRSGEVARRRGRTVYTGPLPSDWDSGEAVSRMRNVHHFKHVAPDLTVRNL